MKNELLFIAFLFAFISTHAQIQNGLVREQNSGKKPIADAQIIFTDAPPASSDQSGNFRIAFSGKKIGDLIFLKEIAKKGYEIVNERELQVLKIGNDNKLGKDIILAKAGVLDAAKKEYYDISDKALWASFNKEKNALQQQLKNAQISQETYLVKFDTLSRQLERQQKSMDALADVFARVNFDDVSEDYKKAFEFFAAGKIDDALVLLERVNLLNRTKNRIQERKRIEKAANNLAQQKSENEKGIKEDIQGIQLQSQLYVLTFQIEKAELLYDQMVRLDSTDLEILMDAADFYRNNHRYNKSLRINTLVIAHPNAEAWQVANAYGYLGDLYILIGDLPAALMALSKLNESYKLLAQYDPTSSFHKGNLAISYEKLGSAYSSLGDLGKALTFYEQYNALEKELYAAFPQNVDFKNGLAISFSRLGSMHSFLGKLEKALTFFEQYNSLEKELCASYPKNIGFKNGLAISYEKLGETHSSLGNLEKALIFYEIETQLCKELYASYPKNMDFKNGLAISYEKLGSTYSSLKNLKKALFFYELETELCKELYASYPQNVGFTHGLATNYSRLGETYSSLGNLEKALTFFEQSNGLEKELYRSHPQNVPFKNGLAISYEKLGSTHRYLGNLPKALTFYELNIELSKELFSSYPQNVGFKHGLAISYEMLGLTYSSLGNLEKALTFYEQSNGLEKELYASYPQNVDFKNGLAITYSQLAKTHSLIGNLEKAKPFFELYIELSKELYMAYPQNRDLKNALAISYSQFGRFYKDQVKDDKKATFYFQECYSIWKELSEENPDHQEFKINFQWVINIMASINDAKDIVYVLNQKIQNEIDTNILFRLYSEMCDTLRHRISFNPQHKPVFAEALNSLAWYGFFLKKFIEVEKAVQEALDLKTDNKFLHTNLAPALLLQGKRDLALQEYQKWRDQPFGEPNLPTYREAFLEDLKAFEKAGIIPPERKADVEAVRKLLNEPKKK